MGLIGEVHRPDRGAVRRGRAAAAGLIRVDAVPLGTRPEDWPGQDYAVMLCRAYRATPKHVGLHKVARVRQLSAWTAELIGYVATTPASPHPAARKGRIR